MINVSIIASSFLYEFEFNLTSGAAIVAIVLPMCDLLHKLTKTELLSDSGSELDSVTIS